MNAKNITNRVLFGAGAAVAFFFVAYTTVPTGPLVVVMNGLFAGAMAAIAVAYWKLLLNAILGVKPYDRVRQMTIGFATCWLAFCLAVGNSVYLWASGAEPTPTALVVGSRFVAVLAAVLQVTAPDFGLGIFHGRDRKMLVAGLCTGLAVAAVVIFAQGASVLAP